MGFFDKIKAAFRKIKTKLIVYYIIIFILLIEPVAPLTASIQGAEISAGTTFSASPFNGTLWQAFFVNIGTTLVAPFSAVGRCLQEDYIGAYFKSIRAVFLLSVIFALVGILKAIPKHEYEDIENGSSDWCENGEQYKILSKNKGIVLAEKNYLPVDKRGNVNVLVVRRFWCW